LKWRPKCFELFWTLYILLQRCLKHLKISQEFLCFWMGTNECWVKVILGSRTYLNICMPPKTNHWPIRIKFSWFGVCQERTRLERPHLPAAQLTRSRREAKTSKTATCLLLGTHQYASIF
jgi:hypothetical protein